MSNGEEYECEPTEARGPDAPKIQDPALIVAGLLLERAFQSAGHPVGTLPAKGGIVLIEAPRVEWVPLFLKFWQKRMQGGAEPADGYGRGWRAQHSWMAWSPEDEPTRAETKEAAEQFALNVSAGKRCVGIASEPSWLPRDLVLAADWKVSVPAPDASILIQAAELLTKTGATAQVDDTCAAEATPRLLRLASRPGQQTADDYLTKLLGLVEAERIKEAPAPSSLRQEPTLDRLHGMDAAVAWGYRLRDDLEAVREGKLDWSEVDRGCLLSGPPGCGKTLFARGLAATCGIPLVSGSYSEWLGSGGGHQGDLLKGMRSAFKRAREQAPSILFIDEVDSFPDRSKVSHRYREWDTQVVNALLAEMDGVQSRDGVILVAACNDPSKLDPALVRSGRLDRHIRISPPDRDALVRILREHLDADLVGTDLGRVALWLTGMTGADCERVVREARQRARGQTRAMALEDLEWVTSGQAEAGLSSGDLWAVCVHEAGHAVIALDLGLRPVESVTIGGGAGILGRTRGSDDKRCLTLDDIRLRVVLHLAGRAAEEAIIGRPSAGAGGSVGSDLARATMLLACAYAEWGLAEDLPPLWLGDIDGQSLAMLMASQRQVASSIADEMAALSAEARGRVEVNKAGIEAVAQELRRFRILGGPEIAGIVERHSPSRHTSKPKGRSVLGVHLIKQRSDDRNE